MKAFYGEVAEDLGTAACHVVHSQPLTLTRARVAVYDDAVVAPRVEEVWSDDASEYIEALSARVHHVIREQGGDIPYTVIREVSENFIHAHFAEPVVSVMDQGRTVRFADQGPGITDKEKALLPGFTTANGEMKRHIRGVGSGLPIVREYLSLSGGTLVIEDNLGSGAVITISVTPGKAPGSVSGPPRVALPGPVDHPGNEEALMSLDLRDGFASTDPPVAKPRLSTRQKQVLALVMETGSAGPSLVSRELGVGISTAYRDLASLEDMELISSDGGKRRLTDAGMAYLDDLISGS